MPSRLTATDYYKYLQCPHWPYYDRWATPEEEKLKRELTKNELARLEDGLAHEAQVVKGLFKGQEVLKAKQDKDAERAAAATLELMRSGAELIYQGTLVSGDWVGRPDLLRRVNGHSSLGEWFYEPLDVKSSSQVQKYQVFQLMFYAVLLERVQGQFPARGYILNKEGLEQEVELGEYVAEFEKLTEDLERVVAGEKPDPVYRKSCVDTGPWGECCFKDAYAKQDIALLFNVDARKLKALRELRIRTLEDAAGMDVTDLDGRAKGLRAHSLEVAKLQAQSLLRQQVIVRKPVTLGTPPLEIHFDIESDPPNDTDYLLGCLVRTPDEETYKPFVARKLADEGKMWREFLDWVDGLPLPYHVIHYASYEHVRLDILERRYGGSAGLERFRANMVDLKDLVVHSVVFPEYFYGLKYLAKFLGYAWRGQVKGGGQSVDVFEEFIKTGDDNLLDQILIYNEDDVRATAVLADWCRVYATDLSVHQKPYPWVGNRPLLYGAKD